MLSELQREKFLIWLMYILLSRLRGTSAHQVKHWKGVRTMFGAGCPTNNMNECDPNWASWMVRKVSRLQGSFKFCV